MPKGKLSYVEAEEIRLLYTNGVSIHQLARTYQVNTATLYPLLRYETWHSPSGQRHRQPTDVGPRLWANIARCDHGTCIYCCWPWLASKNGSGKQGYGVIVDHGRQRKAHIVAWEQWNRQTFPPGKWGLHYCHNPGCANPLHVYPGTAAQNVRDMDKAGRRTSTKGMPRPYARIVLAEINARAKIHGYAHAKVTKEEVESIRAIHAQGLRKQGITRKELAMRYGLSLGGLDHILYGGTWEHESLPIKYS